jgi:hypothetical protein
MRLRNAVAILVIALVLASTCIQIASALPPLENGVSFPAGTFVIPMDEKQADRVLVFGLVHALLYENATLFRVIEPPNVTLSTNMTASPAAFYGGPFLVYPVDSAKVAQVRSELDFRHVTVGQLTAQVTLNNIFRVTQPTKILVVKGEPPWGETDVTLDDMNIPYTIVTHEEITANPNMIFNYTLIVIDCNGWEGHIPSQIADNIRSQVSAGHEVIFTDRALADLNATFPGYVNVSGAQPTDRISNAYAYNPPRKYDPTKYGASADRLEPEFPSQYYNPGPFANNIKVYTESEGYVVSSVPAARVNDVRILADSNSFGTTNNQYAIFAFYFEYGNGIVEGLAFHPQQQTIPTVGNNGYYGVYQLYGNKFVESPPIRFFTLESNPTSRTVYQGDSTTYTITVRSFAGFNLPVTLGVSGLPSGATATFNPLSPQPPPGGTAQSILKVTVPISTPVGSYALNITGTDTSSPPVKKWIIVTLNVITIPPDFSVSVSPNSLTINTTQSKTAVVTVKSIGSFNQNVTLSVTGLPAYVTVTFTPPAPKPPAGSSASSIMRIDVGADAVNGTYPLIIVGSNATTTRSTPFTLIIVKPAPYVIPWLTLLLILLMALVGAILGLLAYAMSSRGEPPAPGRQYVVPVNAQRMRCPNCGRPIALDAVYCPFCGRRRGSPVVSGVVGITPIPRRGFVGRFVGRRAVWGFACAMISGILILLNAGALLSSGFWGPPTGWSSVFWWLGGSSGIGQPVAVLVGLIAGLTVISGGIMMVMRRGPIGAMITLPFAVLSFMIGGGFIAGGILGIVAAILGLVRR